MSYYEELKCPICHLDYNDSTNIPRLLLDCGHTLCSSCIEYSLNTNNNSITCPEEGQQYTNILSIAHFPKNMSLISLIKKTKTWVSSPKPTTNTKIKYMESLKKATKSNRKVYNHFSYCHKHPSRCLEIICLDDKSKICTNCALFGDHKNHNIISIEDFEKDLENKSEIWIDLFEIIDQTFQDDSFTTNIEINNNKFDNLINGIDSKYNEITYTVNTFTNKWIAKIKGEEKEIWGNIAKKFETLNSKILVNKEMSLSLNEKVTKWKNHVQDKLNLLNEITDIDEECLKWIDSKDEKGYNCLIDKGEEIINEIEKITHFPIDNFAPEIKKIAIQIDEKSLIQPLISVNNEKGITELIDMINRESQATLYNNMIKNNIQINGKHKDNEEEEEDNSFNISKFTSDIKCQEDFTVTDSTFLIDKNINVMNNIFTLNSPAKIVNTCAIVNESSGKSHSSCLKQISQNKDNNGSNEYVIKSTGNSNPNWNEKSWNNEWCNASINQPFRNSKQPQDEIPSSQRSKTPDKDKVIFIKTQFKKEWVNWSRYNIGDDGAEVVAEYIRNCQGWVKEIKWTKCSIGDNGAKLIFQELENSKGVTSFNIANNLITNNSVDNLISWLTKNWILETIYLSNNTISAENKEKIKSSCIENKKLKIFI